MYRWDDGTGAVANRHPGSPRDIGNKRACSGCILIPRSDRLIAAGYTQWERRWSRNPCWHHTESPTEETVFHLAEWIGTLPQIRRSPDGRSRFLPCDVSPRRHHVRPGSPVPVYEFFPGSRRTPAWWRSVRWRTGRILTCPLVRSSSLEASASPPSTSDMDRALDCQTNRSIRWDEPSESIQDPVPLR